MSKFIKSKNFVFEALDPNSVLPVNRWFLTRSKFAWLPWNFRKANLRLADGVTALGETSYFRSIYTYYLRPSQRATHEYRCELKATGNRDFKHDGEVYYPAPLDETPDIFVSKSGRVAKCTWDKPDGFRQMDLALNFDFYVRRTPAEG